MAIMHPRKGSSIVKAVVTANHSFDRTVMRRGRAVLAIDGALGGAESAAWAAGQLKR